jgi:O-antigen biosynthesis protein WbqV
LLFLATRLEAYPRSAFVINWFVLLALLGGPRFIYRLIKDRGLSRIAQVSRHPRVPVLLIGASDAAEVFIREMARGATAAPYRVVGVVDDRPGFAGAQIHGVRVFPGADNVTDVIDKLDRRGERPQRIILTERLDGDKVRGLFDAADAGGLTLARLPRLTEFQASGDGAMEVKPIAIEDVLGRPQTVLDRDAMKDLIRDRRVMVTGAGGTIGSELVRQVSAYGPAHLTLYDNSEFSLYNIDATLAESHPALSRSAVLGDVRDRDRLDGVLAAEKPDLVFHAAAYKHVPMVEANPNEGILTNVMGTRNVADACRAAGIATMVMVSTDKAVNPTNVMGATKRIAELYCQALGAAAGGTRFVTVRFGNVLGSTGSVVPLFQRQLAAGGPLTVTHPDMTRYFMTVREAVDLILQATAIEDGDHGAAGEIFVLEMGEPVRIDDLARQMIRLAGLQPGDDIAIEYTGIRPGEKMHEELFLASETLVPTSRAGVLLATSPAADLETLRRQIGELAAAAEARDTTTALALISDLVPAFGAPTEGERTSAAN